jgi:hypothetical protein
MRDFEDNIFGGEYRGACKYQDVAKGQAEFSKKGRLIAIRSG